MIKSSEENPSTTAFTGGRILTMDPERNYADAVVIQGGRIVDVGDGGILKSHPDAKIIDLRGRTLLPAFIDAHNHLSFACFVPQWVNLWGLTSKEAIQEAVERHVLENPRQDWVVGFPWVDAYYGGIELTRKDLDGLGLDRPVLFMHETWHKFVASSQALEMAGIAASTPDPSCGKIFCDGNGEPTGVLWESAGAPLLQLALETSRRRFADLIEARPESFLPSESQRSMILESRLQLRPLIACSMMKSGCRYQCS